MHVARKRSKRDEYSILVGTPERTTRKIKMYVGGYY
jgi:hypothetical protein